MNPFTYFNRRALDFGLEAIAREGNIEELSAYDPDVQLEPGLNRLRGVNVLFFEQVLPREGGDLSLACSIAYFPVKRGPKYRVGVVAAEPLDYDMLYFFKLREHRFEPLREVLSVEIYDGKVVRARVETHPSVIVPQELILAGADFRPIVDRILEIYIGR